MVLIDMEMPNKKNGAVLIIYPDGKCAFEDGKTYQAIPAADVVEVVRCVNCKNWNPRYNKSYKGHFCEVITAFVTEHDYCSFGRKVDGGVNDAAD